MFDRRITQKADIVPVPGARGSSKLENGLRTMVVQLGISAVLDITTAGTLRNRGSILGAFSRVVLSVDGDERIAVDPRSLRVLGEVMGRQRMRAARALTDTTATPLKIQAATALEESLFIPLALPGLAIPSETSLVEGDRNIELAVAVDYAANPLAAIGGGAVVGTVTAPKVRVSEVTDPNRSDLPLLRPYLSEIVQPIAQAGSYEISLRRSKYLAALCIQQDTDAGEVTDMVTDVRVLADNAGGIIPQAVPWAHLVNISSPFKDDGTPVPGYGYAVMNFIQEGRLSKVVHPQASNNLRLVVNAAPSAVAGATNGKLRITLIELDRHPTLTAPTLPFVI